MFAFIQYGIGPQFYSSKIESLSQPHSNASFWGLFHLAGFLFFLLIALDLWETDISLSAREAFSCLFLARFPFFLSTCRDSPGTEAVSFSSLSQTHSTASSRGLFHLNRFIGLVGFWTEIQHSVRITWTCSRQSIFFMEGVSCKTLAPSLRVYPFLVDMELDIALNTSRHIVYLLNSNTLKGIGWRNFHLLARNTGTR